MYKNFLITGLLMLMFSFSLQAQSSKSPTDLPNISVLGNIMTSDKAKNKTPLLKNLEVAFQHYLYPTVKADVILAVHKEKATDETSLEIEEAYVTFTDFFAELLPDFLPETGLGLEVGKKLLSVGKDNARHCEQLDFTEKSIASQHFFGEHGLAAEGVKVQQLLPLPFFSQLELGSYVAATHAHGSHDEDDHEEDEHEEDEHGEDEHGEESTASLFKDRLISARLWNGFNIGSHQEIEIGFSHLIAQNEQKKDKNKPRIAALDLSYALDFAGQNSLKLKGELFQGYYGHDGEERARQNAGFISTTYTFNPFYNVGVRYAYIDKHGDEGSYQSQWSYMATKQLTETSKFRLQFNDGKNHEEFLIQFLFGFGPHSHVLQ